MPKREPVIKSVKKSDPLSMGCEWETCKNVFSNMKAFSDHVTDHLKTYLNFVQMQGQSRDSMENEDILFGCYWQECTHESFPEFTALQRHVYFHIFHTKIKNIGSTLTLKNSLNECVFETTSRNVIPEIPDRLTCCWEHCTVVCDDPELFYLHIANHCDVYPSGNNVEGGCSCQWEGCSTVVKSKHKLKDHMKTHTQEKVVACPGCGALFSNMTRFYDHLKRQTEAEGHTYQCSHCNKRYASERLLKDHMRHHVNYYQCPFCDMTCPNPSNLRLHVRYRHSNSRPFVCDQCSHTCKTQGDLNRHVDIHKGWIHCVVQDCDYRCHSLTNLNRHCKLHHVASEENDRIRFQCHLCQSSYTASFVLTSHLRKKHKFGWPPGHVRFRYKYHEDGFYRLQTVRYESIELTQQILASDIVPETEEVRNGTQQVPPTSSQNPTDIQGSSQPPSEAQPQQERDIYNDVIITEAEASNTKVDYSYNLDLLGDVALKKSTITRSKRPAANIASTNPKPSKRKRKSDEKATKTGLDAPRKKRVLYNKETNAQKGEVQSQVPDAPSVIEIRPQADGEYIPSDVIHQGMEQTVILPSGQRILITSNIPVEFADPIVTEESSGQQAETIENTQAQFEGRTTTAKTASPCKKRRSGLEEKIEELVAMKLMQKQSNEVDSVEQGVSLLGDANLLGSSTVAMASMDSGQSVGGSVLYGTNCGGYQGDGNQGVDAGSLLSPDGSTPHETDNSVHNGDSSQQADVIVYHSLQTAERTPDLSPDGTSLYETDVSDCHGNNDYSTHVVLYPNFQSVGSEFDAELDPEINRELQKAVNDLMD